MRRGRLPCGNFDNSKSSHAIDRAALTENDNRAQSTGLPISLTEIADCYSGKTPMAPAWRMSAMPVRRPDRANKQ
jgi:hypothetical protein